MFAVEEWLSAYSQVILQAGHGPLTQCVIRLSLIKK